MARRTREKYMPLPPPPPTRAMALFPGRVALTIEEFAESSGLTTAAIEAAIADGRLRYGRLGREVRIRIDMWFEGKLVLAPVEATPPDLSAFSAPLPLASPPTPATPDPSAAEAAPVGPPCLREGCAGLCALGTLCASWNDRTGHWSSRTSPRRSATPAATRRLCRRSRDAWRRWRNGAHRAGWAMCRCAGTRTGTATSVTFEWVDILGNPS